MDRFYFLPTEVLPDGSRVPKYLRVKLRDGSYTGTIDNSRVATMRYGLVPAALVLVFGIDQANHDALVANSDVIAVPENLDNNVAGAAIPTIENLFNVLMIPSGWVTTSYTYREVLRRVAGLFQFSQRYQGVFHEPMLTAQSQWNLIINTLSGLAIAKWMVVAMSFGYDVSGIQGTWTVKQALWYLSDQWGANPILLGGIEI